MLSRMISFMRTHENCSKNLKSGCPPFIRLPRIATGHSNFIQMTILGSNLLEHYPISKTSHFLISPTRESVWFFSFFAFFIFICLISPTRESVRLFSFFAFLSSFALSAWNLPCHCHFYLEFF